MYGTVARYRVKPGMEGQLRQLLEEQARVFEAGQVPGFVAAYAYRMKATFPSDHIPSLHPPAGRRSAPALGPAGESHRQQLPAHTSMELRPRSLHLIGMPPRADGIAEAYCPRRTVLDRILVEAAVAAGAELREGFTVQEVLMDGQRVTGIRGQARGGSLMTEQARIVIGADGLHSLVARTVQASTYHEQPTFTCAYYTYWSGVPIQGTELYPRDHRFMLGFPTNDGLVCIAVQWPH